MVYASSSPTSYYYPPFGTTAPANPSPDKRKKATFRDFLECLGMCGACIAVFIYCVAVIWLFISLFVDATSVGGLPVVKIEYVTVSLHNDSTNPPNMLTSEWNVGFTIENQTPWSTLVYDDFNVSIQGVMGRSTVGIVPGFRQNWMEEAANVNTTVRALLPRYNVTSYELRFGVIFLSKVIEASLSNEEYKKAHALFGINNTATLFKGTCADMKIGVHGTHGIVGGPVTCLDASEDSNLFW